MRSLVSTVMALGLASAATITDFNVDPNSVAIRDRGNPSHFSCFFARRNVEVG